MLRLSDEYIHIVNGHIEGLQGHILSIFQALRQTKNVNILTLFCTTTNDPLTFPTYFIAVYTHPYSQCKYYNSNGRIKHCLRLSAQGVVDDLRFLNKINVDIGNAPGLHHQSTRCSPLGWNYMQYKSFAIVLDVPGVQ